ncbi:hypothetical protein P886_1932 [Alteromonadaceae bacterium 2753L.S.0a.02]|nr:hypothetical protein P886_1932 [Alteromonadaceae bacterium 2753L.S.0a.02]
MRWAKVRGVPTFFITACVDMDAKTCIPECGKKCQIFFRYIMKKTGFNVYYDDKVYKY